MEIAGVNIEELDFSSIGSWPKLFRIAAIVVGCVLLLALSYVLIFKADVDTLNTEINTQLLLRTQFKDKYHKAANLEEYTKQMQEMRLIFKDFLRQLPAENRMDALIENISQKATASGLEVVSFKPLVEKNQGFYVELPIELTVVGDYHNFGEFVSNIASMPRIVTLHDFTVKRNEGTGKEKSAIHPLILSVEARTYWYIAEEKIK